MAKPHSDDCEKADVGSECDCDCAGAKHAVRNTRGGQPGAGRVSKRARKAADAAGKAPVVNNRAQPKTGAKTAKDAPVTNIDTGKPISREEAAERMFGTTAGRAKVAAAARKGLRNDKGEPATYDRLPSGLVMGRNPWHPPDIDESKLSTSRDGNTIHVTYDGKPLGSYWPAATGNYQVKTANGVPVGSGPFGAQYASADQAMEALKRATAEYQPGTVVAFNQGFGPSSYATFVRHQRDSNSVILKGADGREFRLPADDVIGRDNRKKPDALGAGGKTDAGDAAQVTSRRRNGDAVTETRSTTDPTKATPAPPAGGGAAATFGGKKVKPVTAAQQPVLEAIGSGSGYRGLPRGAVSNLERTGLITTVFSNGNAHLTDKGHVVLAAQRGDAKHQALNEQVAAAEAEVVKARQAVAANTARRNDPLDRDWSRRSHALQMEEREAYGRWMTLRHQRDAYLKDRTPAPAPDAEPADTPAKPAAAARPLPEKQQQKVDALKQGMGQRGYSAAELAVYLNARQLDALREHVTAELTRVQEQRTIDARRKGARLAQLRANAKAITEALAKLQAKGK